MTPQQVESRLQTVLSDIGIPPISLRDTTHFSHDLGLDSLDIADLLMQVEMQFSIRISDEALWKLKTWGQLKDYILDELGTQRSYPNSAGPPRQLDVYGPSL